MTLRLGELLLSANVSSLLESAGIAPKLAAEKAGLFASSAGRLVREGHGENTSASAVFVPGRIEVLGKHTDYAGGRSLIAAAGHGFCTVAVPRQDGLLRIFPLHPDEHVEFAMDGDLTPTPGDWLNYPMTVARRVARNFRPPLVGADIAFASDLPPAAGMSSSSALMVGTFLAISSTNRLADRPEYTENIDSPESLAEYLATIENGQTFRGLIGDKGVGTFGGSEDHTAMLCCKSGRMSLYSFCPVRFERAVKMPAGYVLAIAASGVVANKTGEAMEKYNRAAELARRAAELWREATGRDDPHLAAICASGEGAVARMYEIIATAKDEKFTPDQLRKRFEQFYRESEEIIPAAADALDRGDIESFGRLVDRSQDHTEKLLCNQVPQTVFLASSARRLGASAASAFGAGFGGSVWALVKSDEAEMFLERWSQAYAATSEAQAKQARFFTTCAGPSAFNLGEIS